MPSTHRLPLSLAVSLLRSVCATAPQTARPSRFSCWSVQPHGGTETPTASPSPAAIDAQTVPRRRNAYDTGSSTCTDEHTMPAIRPQAGALWPSDTNVAPPAPRPHTRPDQRGDAPRTRCRADQMRQARLPGVHPLLIDAIPIAHHQSSPILNELEKRLLGTSGMNHVEHHLLTGHPPPPFQGVAGLVKGESDEGGVLEVVESFSTHPCSVSICCWSCWYCCSRSCTRWCSIDR
jgi:hypothetical protein